MAAAVTSAAVVRLVVQVSALTCYHNLRLEIADNVASFARAPEQFAVMDFVKICKMTHYRVAHALTHAETAANVAQATAPD